MICSKNAGSWCGVVLSTTNPFITTHLSSPSKNNSKKIKKNLQNLIHHKKQFAIFAFRISPTPNIYIVVLIPKRTFYLTFIFNISNFATLKSPEDTATKKRLRYICIIVHCAMGVMYVMGVDFCVAYPGEKAMRRPDMWDRQ